MTEMELLLIEHSLGLGITHYKRFARVKKSPRGRDMYRNMAANAFRLRQDIRDELTVRFPKRSYSEEFDILAGEN